MTAITHHYSKGRLERHQAASAACRLAAEGFRMYGIGKPSAGGLI